MGGMGGSARTAQRRQPARAQPFEQPVQISLDEAYRGTQRMLEIDGRRLEVKIPAGATTGTKVRMAEVGQTGPDGRKGDIYLVVEVLPDARYERKGHDLYTDFETDLYTAVLGGEARVTTPSGQVVLNIPPGTQPGQAFRLAGRGMPHLRSPQTHGDLFARAKISLPRSLSAEQRAVFEKLAKMK
jgi:curved DNA-binding protein